MALSLLEKVDTLYNTVSRTKITRHRVAHPPLGQFCVSLSEFDRHLGDLSDDAYWQRFLIPLKRLRFDFCAAPYNPARQTESVSVTLESQRSHLELCPQLYPDFSTPAHIVLDTLEALLRQNNNPLFDLLIDLTKKKQQTTWVIKESRLIAHVEELVSELERVQVHIVHPLQLNDLTCYDQIIAVGPARWFPDSMFTSARARHVHIVIFDWIRDNWKPKKVFVSPHRSSGPSSRKFITNEEHVSSSKWGEIDAGDLLTAIETTSFGTDVFESKEPDEYEDVEATCVLLEGDQVVFVDASEGARLLILDPDEEVDDRVATVPVKELLPGTFILLRTSGGGDYIVPVANRIMGDQAEKARELQRHWKELLRSYVKAEGLLETSLTLIDLGSNIANEVNLGNWMSPRNIRTQKYEDFLAIMRLVGLEDEATKLWNVMGVINKAHHKAGFEIRQLLLDQVRNLDVDKLQKQGRMDFRLSDDDEVGITAFRVEGILAKALQVSYSRIGHPFKLEDYLWHE